MLKQNELKEYFLGLGNNGALYVWGANGEVISRELIEKLFKTYGNATYTREYYENKLKEGEGKIGGDCSGVLKPVSGYDTTASGYYKKCVSKGEISSIPKTKVCLVFKKNSKGAINHVGCYTGDGYVSEMASSKKNYQRKKLDGNGWELWGMPDFISNPEDVTVEKLEIDGRWGKGTTKASQEYFGTKADGKVSNQPDTCKKYLISASASSWEFKEKKDCSKGSNLIKALQTFLKNKEFYNGKIDGWCGNGTVLALQKFLQSLGYYSGNLDSKMGEQAVMAWQNFLNDNL